MNNKPARFAIAPIAALAALFCSSCQLARDLDSTRQWLVYTEAAHAARIQSRFKEAEQLYKAALLEAEKPTRQNRLVASSLDSLGTLCLEQRRDDEAEKDYNDALEAASQSLAPDDPDLCIYFEDLGSCYALQEKFQKAEPLFQRCVAILLEKRAEQRDLELARCRLKLANVYYHEGELMKAEPLYAKGIPIVEKTQLLYKPLVAQSKKNYQDTLERLQKKTQPTQ